MKRCNGVGEDLIYSQVPCADSGYPAVIPGKLEPTRDGICSACRSFEADGLMNPGRLFAK